MTEKKPPRGSPRDAQDRVNGAQDALAGLQRLENATLSTFAAERDALLETDIPDSGMPQGEDQFAARDPFSADYVAFVHQRETSAADGGARKKRLELRQDLLSRPHLLPTPEESANRGAAAVWRSLRDQLRDESLGMIDSSGREELTVLRNDLLMRKALVDSVGEGLSNLLKRLDQRLAEFDRDDAGPRDGG